MSNCMWLAVTWLKGRRGEAIARQVCGNESSLLVGGLFYLSAFRFVYRFDV